MRLLLFSFFLCNFIFSQDNNVFLYKQFIDGQDTLNYRLLVPKDFEKSKKYPLHLFLHGYGERGSDNNLQLKYIAKLFTDKKIEANINLLLFFLNSLMATHGLIEKKLDLLKVCIISFLRIKNLQNHFL